MTTPTPEPASPAVGRLGAVGGVFGLLARLRQTHLFDYSPATTRAWLGIAGAGLLAGLWALHCLALHSPLQLGLVAIGLLLVAVAALFPLKIPGTNTTVLVADAFIFTLLATLGAPAAVLAAGVEGLIGALRSSRRLTSRVSAPTALMAAMAAGSAAHATLRHHGIVWGLPPAAASLAALCAAALVYVALNTGLLMAMMAIKRGQRLALRDWLDASSGIASMSLGSAFLAGLLTLNAQHVGMSLIGLAAVVVLGLLLLLRRSFARQEQDRAAQDAIVNQAQREAAQSQQRFTAAFTHAAIGMAVVDAGGSVLQVNQALCALVQGSPASLLGSPFCSLLHPADALLFQRQAADVASHAEQAFSMELRCRPGQADDLWVVVHGSRYQAPDGAGHCVIYQLHDITSRHLAERQLKHIAFHDDLTDLANRQCFHARLSVAVERTRLDAEQRFAVLFLDLDRFKVVNDSLGHNAGNTLLRAVGQRLVQCVRPGDLVARLGGDEFAVLLEAVHDPDDALRLAQRVLTTLSQPLAINGTEVMPGASVGVTFSDLGYRTVDEVLRDADLAMYEAKAGGRGRVALFDQSMHDRVAEKLALEGDLRRAIGDGQLSVHFQPLFDLQPYRLMGFEALARWVHPQRGPVSPAVFIALAEESGHICALTDWVVDHAMAQLAEWKRNLPGTAHLGMHVNISGRDLGRADLVSTVQGVLQRHAVTPGTLTLEITETTLMGRLDTALQAMGQLRELGVKFSIDDFGTGYSSLSYLGTLPIDSLKIDRSFVMGLHDKPQNVEIVRAVLTLGQSLGRKVVAEGIETPEQLATLREMGVHIGQGYLLSRPLRAEQVLDLLAVAVATVTDSAANAATDTTLTA